MTRLIRILIIITALMILNSCTNVQPICYPRNDRLGGDIFSSCTGY